MDDLFKAKKLIQTISLMMVVLLSSSIYANFSIEVMPRAAFIDAKHDFNLTGSGSFPFNQSQSKVDVSGMLVGMGVDGFGHLINSHILNHLFVAADYGVLDADFQVVDATPTTQKFSVINQNNWVLQAEDTLSFYDLPWAGLVPFVGVSVRSERYELPNQVRAGSADDVVQRYRGHNRAVAIPFGLHLRFSQQLSVTGRYEHILSATTQFYYDGVAGAKLHKGHGFMLAANWDFTSDHSVAVRASWHNQRLSFKDIVSPITAYKTKTNQVVLSLVWAD